MTTTAWKSIPTTHDPTIWRLIAAVEMTCAISSAARKLCGRRSKNFSLPAGVTKTALLSMKDVGLAGYPSYGEFYERALEQGYELCTPELGLLTRKAFSQAEQLTNADLCPYLYVAMEPAEIGNGQLAILALISEDTSRLAQGVWAIRCMPQTAFGLEQKWLFKIPH
jgi:hypothetical protein